MTIIAVNRKEMAADSLRIAGETKSRAVPDKVHRVGDLIFAATGPSVMCNRFAAWVKAGMPENDKPDLGDNFGALMLTPDGFVECYEECEPLEVAEEFTAMGAGADAALAAMTMGASPARAVEIVCGLNIYTGLPVVVERLNP